MHPGFYYIWHDIATTVSMKKYSLIAIAAVAVALNVASCKKGDYTCRCSGPGPAERNIGVDGTSRKEAKKICDDHEHDHPSGDVKCSLL
jgi:hypothetical protein